MKKSRIFKIVIWVASFLIITAALLILHSLATRPKKIPGVFLPAGVKGKIAVVIDDWGYNLNNLDIIRQIKYPLTASILPNLNYSRILARELRRRNIEIILHLPMEPREKFRLEQNTIMVSMDDLNIMTVLD